MLGIGILAQCQHSFLELRDLLMDMQENQCNQIIIDLKKINVPNPSKTLIFGSR